LSEFDLERAVKERKLDPRGIKVMELYKMLKEESRSKVTKDEVMALIKHITENSGDAQRMDSSDEIDLNDL
jgi:hypothetical protein